MQYKYKLITFAIKYKLPLYNTFTLSYGLRLAYILGWLFEYWQGQVSAQVEGGQIDCVKECTDIVSGTPIGI